MKKIHISKDVVRLLAVGLLIAGSGWGPLLVTETVAKPVSGQGQRDSVVFADFQYDTVSMQLTVTFASGGTYVYQDVPFEVAQDLRRVVNQGEYFAKHVRNQYACEKRESDSLLRLARN